MNNSYKALTSVLLALSVLTLGCSGGNKVRVGKTSAIADELKVMDGAALVRAHAELLPANTIAVAALDMDFIVGELLTEGLGMLPEGWDATEMDQDLAEISIKHLGVDFTHAHNMLLAVTDREEVFVILQGESLGEPEGIKPFEYEGLDVSIGRDGVLIVKPPKATAGTVLMAFDPDHLDVLAKMASGEVGTLAANPALADLTATMEEAGEGILVLGAAPGEGGQEGMLTSMFIDQMRGVDAVALSVSDTLGIAMKGDAQVRTLVTEAIGDSLNGVRNMIAQLRGEIDEMPFHMGFMLIVASHTFEGIAQELEPVVEGDMLSMHVGMPSVDSVLPIALTAGLVSVPVMVAQNATDKFIEPVEEARTNLRALASGATMFYQVDRYDNTGQPIEARRFPASVDPTPAMTCCRELGGPDFDNDNKCDARAGGWEAPGWVEAKFGIMGEHYFVYEMINNGKVDKEASISLRASGDPECDGTPVTYEVIVSVDAETGETVIGELREVSTYPR